MRLAALQEGEVADQTLRALTRKFGGSAKVWLRQVQWHLARGQGEQARKTLDRALNALPKRKHIKASCCPRLPNAGAVWRALPACIRLQKLQS